MNNTGFIPGRCDLPSEIKKIAEPFLESKAIIRIPGKTMHKRFYLGAFTLGERRF